MATARSSCSSSAAAVATTALPILLLVLLFFAAVFPPPAAALNVGIQSVSPSGDAVSKAQECSRVCESDHCNLPPLLKYGKYCGILYSGCPGEPPCDALDACCMIHDACVAAKNDDYLSTECNENLLECLAGVRAAESPGMPGTITFAGNKCMVDEVIDVITLVIEAAVIAGRVLHKP